MDFVEFLSASPEDRAGVFEETAARIGTVPSHVEKDFWVAWTLDLLFDPSRDGPRMLFKGGTSLSKGYDLIHRFSEDVDLTVFREDLGERFALERSEISDLSKTKRKEFVRDLRSACSDFVRSDLTDYITDEARAICRELGWPEHVLGVDAHTLDDPTVFVRYPSVTPGASMDDYVRPAVRLEAGARSATDAGRVERIAPYLASDLEAVGLRTCPVYTISPERTLWDKIMILNDDRVVHETTGRIRADGNRRSRHYYDFACLATAGMVDEGCSTTRWASECIEHYRTFWEPRAATKASLLDGAFDIVPNREMTECLREDYAAMSEMIFGTPPSFEDVLDAVHSYGDMVAEVVREAVHEPTAPAMTM